MRSWSLRYCNRFAALLLLGSLPGTVTRPAPAVAQQAASSAERVLFTEANRERSERGLRPLRWSEPLAQAARNHAAAMIRQNEFGHQLRGEPELTVRAAQSGARFSAIAENIAYGPAAETIHAGWMRSPGHRANILNPQMDAAGIAVIQSGRTLWAVEDLSREVNALTLDQQEQIVGALLAARGLMLEKKTSTSCSTENAVAGRHTALLVTRYSTDDLAELPENLQEMLANRQYGRAEVCAYNDASSSSFAHYNIVVRLY